MSGSAKDVASVFIILQKAEKKKRLVNPGTVCVRLSELTESTVVLYELKVKLFCVFLSFLSTCGGRSSVDVY